MSKELTLTKEPLMQGNEKEHAHPHSPAEELFGFCYGSLEKAYRIFKQHYFECDFLNRCCDRRTDEIGRCNLPYATLPEERELLAIAYEIYCRKEDCNVAYNDTLDLVVDEIEDLIQQGFFVSQKALATHRAAIVIEDGIISAVYGTDPSLRIEITELDKDYSSSEQRDTVYSELEQDQGLQPIDYLHTIPGYTEEVVTD